MSIIKGVLTMDVPMYFQFVKQHLDTVVYNHWTGVVDWNGGFANSK